MQNISVTLESLFQSKLENLYLPKQYLQDIIFEESQEYIESLLPNFHNEFYDLLRCESISSNAYTEIRATVLQKEFKIDTKNLETPEVIIEAYYFLFKKIMSGEIINSYSEQYYEYLSAGLINTKELVKLYNVNLTNEFGIDKSVLNFDGEIYIDESAEFDLDDLNLDEHPNIHTANIDYKKVVDFKVNEVYFRFDDRLLLLDEYLSTGNKVKYSGHNYKWKESIRFRDEPSNSIDSSDFSDVTCAMVNITYFDVNEVWEEYLKEAYMLYHDENYKLAFLMSFIAFESLIEYILYNLQNSLSLYIKESIANNSRSESKLLLDYIMGIIKENNTVSDNIDIWILKKYKDISNPKRNLLDDKLVDVFKIISYSRMNGDINLHSFHTSNPELSSIKKELEQLIKVRNNLVHGSQNNYEDYELQEFHHRMLTILLNIFAFVKDINISKHLIDSIS